MISCAYLHDNMVSNASSCMICLITGRNGKKINKILTIKKIMINRNDELNRTT